jgi:hypothetical protein
MLIPYISIFMMILGLLLQPWDVFWQGLLRITISPSILLTDYVALGGEGPALFNSGLLMLLSFFIIRMLDLRVTGSIFAGILTIGGFGFFGKNILNVTIIFLGVFLFTRFKKISLKSVIVVFLFSTGLSPISSVVLFGMNLPYALSIPLGVVLGTFAGFLLVELSTRAFVFHRGYDLYNVGFASGIISLIFFSVLKVFKLEYDTNMLFTNDSHALLFYLTMGLGILYLLVGLSIHGWNFSGYYKLLSTSGRAITDFTRKNNEALAMINVGITLLGSLIFITLIKVHISGPVIGGLFTIAGFAAFGKHIKNVIPLMLGVYIMVLLIDFPVTVPVILAILFSTALAPIAGEYGILAGIVAGMLHLPVVLAVGSLHGGILLYANGFAAAFTAILITTTFSAFTRQEVEQR